jgi:hypothetical protein
MIGETHLEETIGGDVVKFRKLTPWDRQAILKKLKQQRRAALLQDLRDVQADKGEMLAELRDFDEKPLEEFDFIRHFDTPDGKVDVFEAALSEYEEARRAAIRGGMVLSSHDTVKLAAKLCNIQLADSPANTEGDDPNAGRPTTPTAEPDTYSPTTPMTTP